MLLVSFGLELLETQTFACMFNLLFLFDLDTGCPGRFRFPAVRLACYYVVDIDLEPEFRWMFSIGTVWGRTF